MLYYNINITNAPTISYSSNDLILSQSHKHLVVLFSCDFRIHCISITNASSFSYSSKDIIISQCLNHLGVLFCGNSKWKPHVQCIAECVSKHLSVLKYKSCPSYLIPYFLAISRNVEMVM